MPQGHSTCPQGKWQGKEPLPQCRCPLWHHPAVLWLERGEHLHCGVFRFTCHRMHVADGVGTSAWFAHRATKLGHNRVSAGRDCQEVCAVVQAVSFESFFVCDTTPRQAVRPLWWCVEFFVFPVYRLTIVTVMVLGHVT